MLSDPFWGLQVCGSGTAEIHYQKTHRRRFPRPGSLNFFGCILYGPYFKIQLCLPVADGQGRCQNLAPAAEVQRAQEIKRQSQALLV